MIDKVDLWNNFVSYGVDKLEEFYTLDDGGKQAVVLYNLYSNCQSGDGWEYFFDEMKYYKISFDDVESIVNNIGAEELFENFKAARSFYEAYGFDGDYSEVDEFFVNYGDEIEKICVSFIDGHVYLFEDVK